MPSPAAGYEGSRAHEVEAVDRLRSSPAARSPNSDASVTRDRAKLLGHVLPSDALTLCGVARAASSRDFDIDSDDGLAVVTSARQGSR